MKIAVLADKNVGLEATRFLLTHHADDVRLVVLVEEGEISALAAEHGKEAISWDEFKARSIEDAAAFSDIDLGVLAWWPYLVRTPQLELFPEGYLNFHPSLLPYNRGKHYNFWVLVEQCPFGVTLHKIDSGVDTGPILAQRPIAYGWTDTGATLYEKAQAAILELFYETYPRIAADELEALPQPSGQGSFHHSRELEPASRIRLDDDYRARDLLNLLRARTFPPHPACSFEDEGAVYEVRVSITRRDP